VTYASGDQVKNDICQCNETTSTSPSALLCPDQDVPYVCTSFVKTDVDGTTTRRCECESRCKQQGLGPKATLCFCSHHTNIRSLLGVASEQPVAECTLPVCCKGGDFCDCSSPPWTCPMGTALVERRTPDDFDEAAYRRLRFDSDPSISEVTPVTRCL